MDVPVNQKLWNMLVVQARARFPKWPSLPASKWVHTQYVRHGGQFTTGQPKAAPRKARAKEDEPRGASRKGRK